MSATSAQAATTALALRAGQPLQVRVNPGAETMTGQQVTNRTSRRAVGVVACQVLPVGTRYQGYLDPYRTPGLRVSRFGTRACINITELGPLRQRLVLLRLYVGGGPRFATAPAWAEARNAARVRGTLRLQIG
jgi:hypothetical protein